MTENDITNVLFETFSVTFELFGEKHVLDLKPDGRSLEVTEANKAEYVDLMVKWLTHKRFQHQLDALSQGFRELIPTSVMYMLGPEDLQLLLGGQDRIDVNEIRATALYQGGYSPTSPQVEWFWRYMELASGAERAQVLSFVTGTNKVPLDGLDPPFTIVKAAQSGVSHFPSSHTCFNSISVPEYPTEEVLRTKLSAAIKMQEGFQIA